MTSRVAARPGKTLQEDAAGFFEREARISQPRNLPEEIAREIGAAIDGGELKPGERLPTERALCERYGVSRAVVREAISRLRSDGRIVTHQGKGIFVSEAGSRSSFRITVQGLGDDLELAQILEFLSAVECAATRLAAERRTEEDLERIGTALDAMRSALGAGELGAEEDFRFHQAIVDATRNPHFQTFSAYLEVQIRRLIRETRTNTSRFAGLADKVQGEHQAIFEAIAARDPVRAGVAAETHLRNAAARLKLYRDAED